MKLLQKNWPFLQGQLRVLLMEKLTACRQCDGRKRCTSISSLMSWFSRAQLSNDLKKVIFGPRFLNSYTMRLLTFKHPSQLLVWCCTKAGEPAASQQIDGSMDNAVCVANKHAKQSIRLLLNIALTIDLSRKWAPKPIHRTNGNLVAHVADKSRMIIIFSSTP